MKFYFDTEFLDDGHTIELISIGIVNEAGQEYYAVNSEFDEGSATEWLQTRVLAHIPRDFKRKLHINIAQEVQAFLRCPDGAELWGWYPAYDWVALCQLYGPMVNRPRHFPKRANDLKQTLDALPPDSSFVLPRQTGTKHNALEDAKWVKDAHTQYLVWKWARDQRRYPIPSFGGSDSPLLNVPRGATGF